MGTQTTRRALIGGAGLAAVVAVAPRVARGQPARGKDADLLAHWEARQRLYAQLIAAGAYYDPTGSAKAQADEHDIHETKVIEAQAFTPEGLLAQAWVAWEAQGTCFADDDRARHHLIHAADFDTLNDMDQRKELDWDDVTQLAVIRGLRTLAGKA
jgi:hypothetical protein